MGASQSQEEPLQLQSERHQQPQPQPQPHEPPRRESWLSSPQASTKKVDNATKFNETQSMMPLKPGSFKGPIPHNYEHILKEADSPLANSSSWGKLLDQLYAGVFLAHKTKASSMSFSSKVSFFFFFFFFLITLCLHVSSLQKWTCL